MNHKLTYIIISFLLVPVFVLATDPIDPNGFDVISSNSFEDTTVVETFVDRIIAPDESISANGVTVTASGITDATTTISSAIDQFGRPGLLIEVAGGEVTLEFTEPLSQTAGAMTPAAIIPMTCPDPTDATYPIKFCWKEYPVRLVNIWVTLPTTIIPVDMIFAARIPGDGSRLAEGSSETFFRSYFTFPAEGSRLVSKCDTVTNCEGEPVLFVHGYQTEFSGYNLIDNGGRDYWGYFPDNLARIGYSPFEFIWHTNARFLDVAEDLDDAIKTISSETGKKVHIVAHSFGGILTRRLLQDPGFVGVASSIASVTTIGSPHLGVFDKQTTYHDAAFPENDITFPGGQDSVLFEGHGQISPHLMGEDDFGFFISGLLQFDKTPGSEPYFLASKAHLLPAVKIQNLVGFTKIWTDGDPYEFRVRKGDYLISGESQRFLNDFVFSGNTPPWLDFQSVQSIDVGNATLTEYALGRHAADDFNLELHPDQDVNAEDFIDYKHSTGVVSRLKADLLKEPYVPYGYNDGYNDGYHDGYQRAVNWIISNPAPPPTPSPQAHNRLNDTGIVWGAGPGSIDNPTCVGDYISAQDCSHGRDATHNDPADGPAGFSFTKLDSNGFDRPNPAVDWDCVRDDITGLIWEVKTNDGGLRDRDNEYSWYNPDFGNNGGNSGRLKYGGSCSGLRCDTDGYVLEVNNMEQALCGARDWKMPTKEELRSILNLNVDGLLFNSDYFPHANSQEIYWTGSPYAADSNVAWMFLLGSISRDWEDAKSNSRSVILVRRSK